MPESLFARPLAVRRTPAKFIADLNDPTHTYNMSYNTYDVKSMLAEWLKKPVSNRL
jgi:hypothetical protein